MWSPALPGPWRRKQEQWAPTCEADSEQCFSSFSPTDSHLSLAEGKSAFPSNERLLLGQHMNQICPTVDFHFADLLVTTTSCASEVMSLISSPALTPHLA